MFDQEFKLTIVQSVIDIAVINRYHPYDVLSALVEAMLLTEPHGQELYSDCKIILRGRSEELPWNLT